MIKIAYLIDRLESLLGITLSQRVKKSISMDTNMTRTIIMLSDISAFPKIKRTNLIEISTAKCYSYHSALYMVRYFKFKYNT